jgi:hypothetical protein
MINLTGAERSCDGCLGSRKCWVCLGNGQIENRFRMQTVCPACDGTGVCAQCLVVPDQPDPNKRKTRSRGS